MKCSRAQWRDPEFRKEYDRKRRKKHNAACIERYHAKKNGTYYGVFANPPSFYRHNGNPVWGVR